MCLRVHRLIDRAPFPCTGDVSDRNRWDVLVEAAAATVGAILRANDLIYGHDPRGYRYVRYKLRVVMCGTSDESQEAAYALPPATAAATPPGP